jgi:hypothetical protein
VHHLDVVPLPPTLSGFIEIEIMLLAGDRGSSPR